MSTQGPQPLTSDELSEAMNTAIAELDAAKAEAQRRDGNWGSVQIYNAVEDRCRVALTKVMELWLGNRDRVRFFVWSDPEYPAPLGDVIQAHHTQENPE